MIAYQSIGNNGRIGNQLFQIASTIGIAVENGHDFIFNHSEIFEYLPKLKNHTTYDFNNITNTYFEQDFCYQDIKISESENLFLYGYFQSYKYFEKSKNLIFDLLEIKNPFFESISKNLNFSNSCSLHVRRGDYVKISQSNPLNPHPLQSIDYYKEAINLTNANRYFVFSDDIEWCKKNLTDERLIFIDYPDKKENYFAADLCELQLMSLCNNNIIANSSFSWWAAYLNTNKNKKVIAPKMWFSDEYVKIISEFNSNKVINSLIPENWIII
jgi:hypothetical protein